MYEEEMDNNGCHDDDTESEEEEEEEGVYSSRTDVGAARKMASYGGGPMGSRSTLVL